jgi:hypothetical protein
MEEKKMLLLRPYNFWHDPMPEIPVNIVEPLLSACTFWKENVKFEIVSKDQHKCTQCEYKYTKKKKCKHICLEIITVHQKIRSSSVMSVNRNVLKEIHKNHKE